MTGISDPAYIDNIQRKYEEVRPPNHPSVGAAKLA